MKPDWKRFLSQYDLVYENAPVIWQDGLPIGNGNLGALFYAPYHPEWVINKSDVWDYRSAKFKRIKHKELLKLLEKRYAGKLKARKGEHPDTPIFERLLKESPPDSDKYPCPKTCGNLRIRVAQDNIYITPHKIRCRTSLCEGTLRSDLDKHLSHPRITSFVHRKKNILAIRMSDVSFMGAFSNAVELYRARDELLPPARFGARGDTIWIDQHFPDAFRFIMMAKIVPQGAHAYREMYRKTVRKKHRVQPSREISGTASKNLAAAPVRGDFDVFVTVATSLETRNPLKAAESALKEAAKTGFNKLHAEHKRAWADFWKKSYVELEDKFLEGLWYYSLYATASALSDTPPAAGLLGLWFGPVDTPEQVLPWRGSYTNDYNTQAAVLPVFQANHPELADGFLKTFRNMLPQVKKDTRQLFGLPGAMVPLSCAPDGKEVTNGSYRYVHCSGPEWGQLFLWRYYYTKDKKFLKRVIYPFLREVVIFFQNYMYFNEKRRRYELHPSQEAEFFLFKPNPVSTLIMLKYTLKGTIEAAKLLRKDKNLVHKWEDLLERFPEYPTSYGEYLSWEEMVKDFYGAGIRTLNMVYPTGEVNLDSPEGELDKARKTFLSAKERTLQSYAAKQGISGSSGMARFIILPALRLGRIDEAWDELTNRFLKSCLKPSGLISHNPSLVASPEDSERNARNIPDAERMFTYDGKIPKSETATGRLRNEATPLLATKEHIFPSLEGNGIYLAIINEMLMQCREGKIILFPGMTKGQNGRFENLRTEGAFLVSSEMKKGKVRFIKIKALAGGKIKVRNPWKGKDIFIKARGVSKMRAAEYIELSIKKGRAVVLSDSKGNLKESPRAVKPHYEAKPRFLQVADGSVLWYGKPDYPEYYGKLREGMLV